MKPLIIEANNKQAKYGAVTMGIITLFMVGIVIGMIVGGADWGGPFTWIFGGIFFGCMYAWLIGTTLLISQLIFFQGPLITINSHGITDHFNRDNFLSWDEVKFISIKRHVESPIAVFKAVPKARSLKFYLLKVMGRAPLEYPEPYLSVSTGAITQYITDVAPSGILKK